MTKLFHILLKLSARMVAFALLKLAPENHPIERTQLWGEFKKQVTYYIRT